MAIRSSMTDLIARVRTLIGDSKKKVSDEDVQAFLDANSEYITLYALEPVPSQSGTTISYLTYRDKEGWAWESNSVLQDTSGTSLTPSTSYWLIGEWTFSATHNYVQISGRRFDLYGAAFDACAAYIAALSDEFDFEADKKKFYRSQTANTIMMLMASYENRRRLRPVSMGVSDVRC